MKKIAQKRKFLKRRKDKEIDWELMFNSYALGILLTASSLLIFLTLFPVIASLLYVLMTYSAEAILIFLVLKVFPSKRIRLHMKALSLYFIYDMITKMSYYIDSDLFTILNNKIAYGFIIFVGVILVIGGLGNGRSKLRGKK